MRLGLFVTVLASFATLAAAQRLPVQIEVRPLFGTTVPPTSCLPLKIVVQNDGPSIEATLVVSPSRARAERRHLFPLPLPTGSRKEVIATPFVLSNTMSISVRLEGVRGIPEQTISVTPNDNVRLIVAVGDEIGGLEWLRQLNLNLNRHQNQDLHLTGIREQLFSGSGSGHIADLKICPIRQGR